MVFCTRDSAFRHWIAWSTSDRVGMDISWHHWSRHLSVWHTLFTKQVRWIRKESTFSHVYRMSQSMQFDVSRWFFSMNKTVCGLHLVSEQPRVLSSFHLFYRISKIIENCQAYLKAQKLRQSNRISNLPMDMTFGFHFWNCFRLTDYLRKFLLEVEGQILFSFDQSSKVVRGGQVCNWASSRISSRGGLLPAVCFTTGQTIRGADPYLYNPLSFCSVHKNGSKRGNLKHSLITLAMASSASSTPA